VDSGLEVGHRADEEPSGDGQHEIAAIASDLREFERAIGEGGAAAVLVASDSSAALAAVVVATKLGVPVACLESPAASEDGGSNARVIRQLADSSLAPDLATVVDWVAHHYPDRA
jgi:UDP-N-acetylglucosamine 2-epimerase